MNTLYFWRMSTMKLDPKNEAVIFDIQGFSVHDGPGGRTLVFFKGCPLRCYWCCNPESQIMQPQLMYRHSNCLKCYGCIGRNICPNGAISLKNPGDYVVQDRSICDHCKTIECADKCYHEALKVAGKIYTIDDVMRRLERERSFWGPNGGVTLGGGEVTMQWQFASELLRRCHDRYINTAIETCSYAPWEHLEPIYENIDWAFTDIKHMNPEKHKDATGVDNELILKNIAKIADLGKKGKLRHIIRIPVVQGFNADDENIQETIKYIKEIGTKEVNILPFHRLGASKYEQLGRIYDCRDMQGCPEELLNHIQKMFIAAGLTCYVGSDTPF